MQSNTVSILTDCPHREKLGWLEQDHLVGPSLMYDEDTAALFTKVCNDMADAQTEDEHRGDIGQQLSPGAVQPGSKACPILPWPKPSPRLKTMPGPKT